MSQIGELQDELNRLFDELMDLLDETAPEDRGPIYARIDALHRWIIRLVGKVINANDALYEDVLDKAKKATEAVEDARKQLGEVIDALKVVDAVIKVVILIAKAGA